MKFRKGNRYRYGQDFSQHRGIPAGIEFSVTRFSRKDMFVLMAPGYGDLSTVDSFGNGKLYVWGLTARQRKRFREAAEATLGVGGKETEREIPVVDAET